VRAQGSILVVLVVQLAFLQAVAERRLVASRAQIACADRVLSVLMAAVHVQLPAALEPATLPCQEFDHFHPAPTPQSPPSARSPGSRTREGAGRSITPSLRSTVRQVDDSGQPAVDSPWGFATWKNAAKFSPPAAAAQRSTARPTVDSQKWGVTQSF
jgi:hypothetical protein